jgi:hypothetical protein
MRPIQRFSLIISQIIVYSRINKALLNTINLIYESEGCKGAMGAISINGIFDFTRLIVNLSWAC